MDIPPATKSKCKYVCARVHTEATLCGAHIPTSFLHFRLFYNICFYLASLIWKIYLVPRAELARIYPDICSKTRHKDTQTTITTWWSRCFWVSSSILNGRFKRLKWLLTALAAFQQLPSLSKPLSFGNFFGTRWLLCFGNQQNPS